ncbi:MAG: class I SAM-dependent methyltransferase [Bacteroidota bacterium]
MEPIYDSIGTNYNSTRRADPYIVSRLLHFLTPRKDGSYLDIGCGTGNYTIALAEAGLLLFGMEPSLEMLNEARRRYEGIWWTQGFAEEISILDESFSGAIATLTIHHWTDIHQGFKEIARVLKLGGRFVLFTATPAQMEGYWLNHYFPEMLRASIAKMPSLELITDALTRAGLKINETEKYFIKDGLQDKFLYCGKNNPGIYLDETIRKGISSFAALANETEVAKGLEILRDDLKTGRFGVIKNTYSNSNGDYLFIVAEKMKPLDL